MVAKIATPHRVQDALNYNELKLRKGKAELLAAEGYLTNPEGLNFYQKLAGLEIRNSLNDRARTKTLHISLNFDPTEKLSNEILERIADDYMNRIGFAGQPYLLYRHHDAGHPHLHIVTTTIKSDGSRIPTHNLGRNQSEKARKAVEEVYGLFRAQKGGKQAERNIKPIQSPVNYGKDETKRSIAGVVTQVMNTYTFCSLPEFNAALRQYNVVADRGKEGSRTFQNRGLIYRILDDNGNKVGVPIKASLIPSRPTLPHLEKVFEQNRPKKEAFKPGLREGLQDVLKEQNATWKDFIDRLSQNGIVTVVRKNEEGRIYGVTFVDNRSRCVINGSDLGRAYSAVALQSRLHLPVSAAPDKATSQLEKTVQKKSDRRLEIGNAAGKEMIKTVPGTTPLMDTILSPLPLQDSISTELMKKKRKRKNKTNKHI